MALATENTRRDENDNEPCDESCNPNFAIPDTLLSASLPTTDPFNAKSQRKILVQLSGALPNLKILLN